MAPVAELPLQTHITSSPESDQQPPLLSGLVPIYIYIHIHVKDRFVSSFCAWLIGNRFCCPCVNVPSVSPCYRQISFNSLPPVNLQIRDFSQTHHHSVLGVKCRYRPNIRKSGGLSACRLMPQLVLCGDSALMPCPARMTLITWSLQMSFSDLSTFLEGLYNTSTVFYKLEL